MLNLLEILFYNNCNGYSMFNNNKNVKEDICESIY